jgi:hypothetical protein
VEEVEDGVAKLAAGTGVGKPTRPGTKVLTGLGLLIVMGCTRAEFRATEALVVVFRTFG